MRAVVGAVHHERVVRDARVVEREGAADDLVGGRLVDADLVVDAGDDARDVQRNPLHLRAHRDLAQEPVASPRRAAAGWRATAVAAFATFGGAPVDPSHPSPRYPDGQNWDVATFHLPPTARAWLSDDHSPLIALGGFDGTYAESRRIIDEVVVAEPLGYLAAALAATLAISAPAVTFAAQGAKAKPAATHKAAAEKTARGTVTSIDDGSIVDPHLAGPDAVEGRGHGRTHIGIDLGVACHLTAREQLDAAEVGKRFFGKHGACRADCGAQRGTICLAR